MSASLVLMSVARILINFFARVRRQAADRRPPATSHGLQFVGPSPTSGRRPPTASRQPRASGWRPRGVAAMRILSTLLTLGRNLPCPIKGVVENTHFHFHLFFTSCPFQGMKKSLEKYVRSRRRGQHLVGGGGGFIRTGRPCARARAVFFDAESCVCADRPCMTFCDQLCPHVTICDHLWPFVTMCDHL